MAHIPVGFPHKTNSRLRRFSIDGHVKLSFSVPPELNFQSGMKAHRPGFHGPLYSRKQIWLVRCKEMVHLVGTTSARSLPWASFEKSTRQSVGELRGWRAEGGEVEDHFEFDVYCLQHLHDRALGLPCGIVPGKIMWKLTRHTAFAGICWAGHFFARGRESESGRGGRDFVFWLSRTNAIVAGHPPGKFLSQVRIPLERSGAWAIIAVFRAGPPGS